MKKLLSFLFPITEISNVELRKAWQKKHFQLSQKSSMFFLALVVVGEIFHWLFLDSYLGLVPVNHWGSLRLGLAVAAAILFLTIFKVRNSQRSRYFVYFLMFLF